MILFRERGPSSAVEPVQAFTHGENNPTDGIVDISGEIVPFRTEHKYYGPPLPIEITDTSSGDEKILFDEQAALAEIFKPQTELGTNPKAEQNQPAHIRRPLSMRRLAH